MSYNSESENSFQEDYKQPSKAAMYRKYAVEAEIEAGKPVSASLKAAELAVTADALFLTCQAAGKAFLAEQSQKVATLTGEPK